MTVRFATPTHSRGIRIAWGGEAACRYRVLHLNADGSEPRSFEVADGRRSETRDMTWPLIRCIGFRLECLEPTGNQGYQVRDIELIH